MSVNRSGLRGMPAGIWVLGLVSLLMDISSEMIHSLLPLFMVTVLAINAVGDWLRDLLDPRMVE